MITMYHSIIKKQILEASVQVISVAQSCPTLCDTMNRSQAYLSITNSQSSLKLTSIESVMPSSHLNLCRPLFLLTPTPPTISLFQQHRLKALILWHSAFFMVQLSHPDMTTGKTIALTRRTFVGKVMSLLFLPSRLR